MAVLTKDQMVEAIKEMSLVEMNELVKALEEEFNVSAAAMVMAAGGGAAGGASAAADEKSEFDVVLKNGGSNKIAVIKAVRVLKPELGLKEAKDLVDAGGKILEGANKETAEAAKKSLEEAGAVVELG